MNCFFFYLPKQIIIVKTHFKIDSCNEFNNILLKETKLLDSISSAHKYCTKTAVEEINQSSA